MTLIEILEEVRMVYSPHAQDYICPICEQLWEHADDCDLMAWIKVCKESQAVHPWVDITEDIEALRD